jgi:hypothetical protein
MPESHRTPPNTQGKNPALPRTPLESPKNLLYLDRVCRLVVRRSSVHSNLQAIGTTGRFPYTASNFAATDR